MFVDSQERLSFLEAVAKKVNNPNSQDAYVYATVAVATVKLELKDLEGARKDLDKSEKILDGFDSVETIVHASFYKVNAEYYQVRQISKAERLKLISIV
jgi:26S proteasome regulatory subunit N9